MIVLNKYEISANIEERYATSVYAFHFANRSEHGSTELKFDITIDPHAFISKFEAIIDDELFIGKTKEKKKAAEQYHEAKKKNENAVLITQPHDDIQNVFQIKTNIDSNSKILFTLQIEQYLQRKFEYNYLNIEILKKFEKYNIKPCFDHMSFNIDIKEFSGIYDVNIPSTVSDGKIVTEQMMNEQNNHCQIQGKITIDDNNTNALILRYKTKGEDTDSHVLFDTVSNTFCHIVSDIISDSVILESEDIEGLNEVMIPRRVMFVIDRSGSMSGSKWSQTISATITAIKGLRKGYDRFGIILFDDALALVPYTDTRGCILATDKSVNDAIVALNKADIGGCTNINDALLKGIQVVKIDILLLNNDDKYEYNFFVNQMIFITDGEPNEGETDTNKIVSNIKCANDLSKIDKYHSKIGIFSFGVGSDGNDSGWIQDLNHSFLKILALNNNGLYQRIKESSADTGLSECFKVLSEPVVCNIMVQYKNKNISDLTQSAFNTLYAGNDLLICGKVIDDQKHDEYNLEVTISAITGEINKEKNTVKPVKIEKEMMINVNTNDNMVTNNAERIWCYLKLEQYAIKRLIQTDMIEMDDDEKHQVDALPLALALEFSFVTPWTSMIVVKGKVALDSDIVIQQHIPASAPEVHHSRAQSSLFRCQTSTAWDDADLQTLQNEMQTLSNKGSVSPQIRRVVMSTKESESMNSLQTTVSEIDILIKSAFVLLENALKEREKVLNIELNEESNAYLDSLKEQQHKLMKYKALMQNAQKQQQSLLMDENLSSAKRETKMIKISQNTLYNNNTKNTINNFRSFVIRTRWKIIDPTQYESWNPNQIAQWIISLDPEIFGPYENLLMKTLWEAEVSGADIHCIDRTDLRDWGIDSFVDRINIENHIRKLVQNNNCTFKRQNEQIMEEQKETKSKLFEVKTELKNYMQWSSDELVDWIVFIENGKYKKYEERLRQIFKKESVNGANIHCINKTDLRGWGIDSFVDRVNIEKHIRKLVHNNN